MKTTVVYFDSKEEGIKGTLRGLIASTLLFPTFFFQQKFNLKFYLSNFLLSSAIGVQIPASPEEAAVYALLVGVVVFGSIFCFTTTFPWIYVLIGSGYSCFVGYLTYVLAKQLNLYVVN
tara:strand:+ start:428 stop:784 length:357 start_codon:yes stop_codon:yes gene_type:complete